VCSSILALTLLGKIFALMGGAGLLAQPHPFLPGSYKVYVWIGLIMELVALMTLVCLGSRAFLTLCIGLAILFIGYHFLEAGLRIAAPCPCLGGVLSHWKTLTRMESGLSFGLACVLGVSSFIGLFPASEKVSSTPLQQPVGMASIVAFASWLAAGALVIWFWRGRVVGGDEGMEAAKSFQLLIHPENVKRMWNDQPALFSIIGAYLFRLFGASLTTGRIAVVALESLLPVTLAVYWSRFGIKWAAVVSVILLWLTVPLDFTSFMLEAPAYCIGIAALLPLMLHDYKPLTFGGSVFLASLALSIKLTAVFALVVPFVWLLQRGWQRAFMWGALTVGLAFLGTFIQPGWSWSSMMASHLDFRANQIWAYNFEPTVYARGWLICALSVFSIASRYVSNRLSPTMPWLSAAVIALVVHLIHRPFWSYYDIHLITPMAVLAGCGAVDLWQFRGSLKIPRPEGLVAVTAAVLLCVLWVWQQGSQIVAKTAQAEVIANSSITKGLRALADSGHSEFSINPLWTFAAGQTQTPPELTIIPLKRVWSGQLDDKTIAQMLNSNKVDAIVLAHSVLQNPAWTNLLSSYLPTAEDGGNVLFVRRDLRPHPIDIERKVETQEEMLHKLDIL
jgi:hypothetical protein